MAGNEEAKDKGGGDSEISGFLGWSGTVLGLIASSSSKVKHFYSSVFWWFFGIWVFEFVAHLVTWCVLNRSEYRCQVCNYKFAYFERPGRALWHGHATDKGTFNKCFWLSVFAITGQTGIVISHSIFELNKDIKGDDMELLIWPIVAFSFFIVLALGVSRKHLEEQKSAMHKPAGSAGDIQLQEVVNSSFQPLKNALHKQSSFNTQISGNPLCVACCWISASLQCCGVELQHINRALW